MPKSGESIGDSVDKKPNMSQIGFKYNLNIYTNFFWHVPSVLTVRYFVEVDEVTRVFPRNTQITRQKRLNLRCDAVRVY